MEIKITTFYFKEVLSHNNINNLNKGLSKGIKLTKKDFPFKDSLKLWYKIINIIPSIFKKNDLELLYTFFINLRRLNQNVEDLYLDNSLNIEYLKMMEDTETTGRDILKKIFNEDIYNDPTLKNYRGKIKD